MRRTLGFTLFVALIILSMLLIQPPVKAEANGYLSWVNFDVIAFDGQGILGTVTLSTTGIHDNGSVYVYGDYLDYGHTGEICFPGTNCVTSTGIVGRIVRQVTSSGDGNETTFQYTAKWVQTYSLSNQFFGLPVFPLDVHLLTIFIGTNFNLDIDTSQRIPSLPTAHYEGFYSVKPVNATHGSPYEYELDLQIRHPVTLQFSLLIWSWGVILLILLATIVLASGLRLTSGEPLDDTSILYISSGMILFVPLFELTLTSFETPLGVTWPDMVLYFLMLANVFQAVSVVRKWSRKRYFSTVLVSSLILLGFWIIWLILQQPVH